jgi:hypothetical protein
MGLTGLTGGLRATPVAFSCTVAAGVRGKVWGSGGGGGGTE